MSTKVKKKVPDVIKSNIFEKRDSKQNLDALNETIFLFEYNLLLLIDG